jgi:hypothetical protein
MERRLVGSTLARMPYEVASGPARQALDVGRALEVIAALMGDADPQVQKALSWALREWSRVAPDAVERFLQREAAEAAQTADGHRAWVIRDAIALLDPRAASELRARVAGIRRRGEQPSTSDAARAAASFSAPLALSDQAVEQQGERFARRTA